MNRCQVCGRRKGLRQDGGVVKHHVRGVPCEGAGFPPLEQTDTRLETLAVELRALARRKRQFVRQQLADRVNWIDPRHDAIATAADSRASTLERRLRWHRGRAARNRRYYEKFGYTLDGPLED